MCACLCLLCGVGTGHPRTGALEVCGALGVVAGFILVSYRGRDKGRNENHGARRIEGHSVDVQGGMGEEGTQLERQGGARGPSTASDGRLLSQL